METSSPSLESREEGEQAPAPETQGGLEKRASKRVRADHPLQGLEVLTLEERLTELNGKRYWYAELQRGALRVRCDTRYGSWMIFAHSENPEEQLPQESLSGQGLRELLPPVASMLAKQVRLREAAQARAAGESSEQALQADATA